MKRNIYNILLVALAIMTASSCDNFLDVPPTTTWEAEDFYETATEVEMGLMGIYNHLGQDGTYGSYFMANFMTGNDEALYSRSYNENWSVAFYRHSPATTELETCWYELYKGIDAANKLIEAAPYVSSMDSVAREAAIGEAHFLRALYYFDLTRWWGEVPLRTKSTTDITDNNKSAASVAEVYAQIISDLEIAAKTTYTPEEIDENGLNGRAHTMAAYGLLAKVHLTMAGAPLLETSHYQDAVNYCDTVMQYGYHGLNDDYQTTFRNYISDIYDSKETLFEVSFQNLHSQGLDETGRNGNLNGISFTYGGEGYPYAYAYMYASARLINAYEYGDERKDWNIANFKFDKADEAINEITNELRMYPGKFRRWEPENYDDIIIEASNEPYTVLEAATTLNKNFTGINFPILRYSDILLMYAEAKNEADGAPSSAVYDAIDEIRKRAGLEDLNRSRNSTQNQVRQEIRDERLREFCFEGQRQHDLIRWGELGNALDRLQAEVKASESYGAEGDMFLLRAANYFDASKHLTLPYPLQEATLNDSLDQKSNW